MMKPMLRWVDKEEVLRLLDWEDLLLFNVRSTTRLPFIYKVVGDSLDDVNLRVQCGWLCVEALDVFMTRNWELLRGGEGVFTEMAEEGVFEEVVEYTDQSEVITWYNEKVLGTMRYMGVYKLDTPLVNPVTHVLSREINDENPLLFICKTRESEQRWDLSVVRAARVKHEYKEGIAVLLEGVDILLNKVVTVDLMSEEFYGLYTFEDRYASILSEETPEGCYALRHDGEVVRLFRTSRYAFTTSSGDLYMSNGTYRSSWDTSTHRRYEKETYGELNIKRLLTDL